MVLDLFLKRENEGSKVGVNNSKELGIKVVFL